MLNQILRNGGFFFNLTVRNIYISGGKIPDMIARIATEILF